MTEEELKQACDVLPAWFVPRMADDEWTFCLLLSTGQGLIISSISSVNRATDGSIWLDVNMIDRTTWGEKLPFQKIEAPTSRKTASVNASHIVAAFEIADT